MHTFDKMLSLMLKPWVIVPFLALSTMTFLYIDQDLAVYLYNFKLRETMPVLNWITYLGKSKIYLLSLPILAIIFAYGLHKKIWSIRAWALWVIVLYPNLITFVLKCLFGRARPIVLFDNQLFGFFGFHTEGAFHSFPSGHTTTITSLMIGLLILFPRYCYLFLVIGILVISSRVLLTYHYLSDILVSFYLVVFELGLLFYVVRRKYPNICELILNDKVI